MQRPLQRRAAAVALGLPLLALAQAPADPAPARIPAQPLVHRSAFADYQPYRDVAPGDWRRLNDAVGAAALKPAAGAPAPEASGPAPSRPMPRHEHPPHHRGGGK
jgi:hypothetical protein